MTDQACRGSSCWLRGSVSQPVEYQCGFAMCPSGCLPCYGPTGMSTLPPRVIAHESVTLPAGFWSRGGQSDLSIDCNWSLLRSWLRPHRGLSQEQLSLYLSFFEVVHNVRQRGQAFLHAFVALLVTEAHGLHHERQLGRDDRVFQHHAVRDFYLYTAHLYSIIIGRRRATRVVMAPSSQGAVIAIITFRREGTPQ